MDFLNDDDSNDNLKKTQVKRSLLSRILKNEEGQFYSEVIIKGFVWVIMFVISIVALVLVFRSGNNNVSKEVVVVSNKNSNNYMEKPNPSATQNNNDFTFNNSVAPNSTTSNNSNNSLGANAPSKIQKNNDNIPAMSGNDEIGSLIKNNSQSINQTDNQTFDQTDNDNPAIASNNQDNNDNNNSNNNTSNDVTNNVAQNDNVTPNQTPVVKLKPVVKPKRVAQAKPKPKVVNKVINSNNIKASSDNSNIIWLVTVFSADSLDKARSKWLDIQRQHPELFMNKQAYFIKTNVNNRVYYRVSLGDAEVDSVAPKFINNKDAKTYCDHLKTQNVACFPSTSTTTIINNLIKSMVN